MPYRAKSLILLYLLVALVASAAAQRPTYAKQAMVVSVHQLASEAGVEMLKAGGNAVDAAVATGFALAVVHPPAGNLGGGGFMLVRWHDGRDNFLDYREKAPMAADREMYLNQQGDVVSERSTVGYLAIGVPGSVAGMVYAQQKWGKLPLKRVIQPAIRLAQQGFALTWSDARDFREEDDLAKFPESYRIFQRNGRYYEPGEIFRQPELARTLQRIAADPSDFYSGKMAQQIAAAVQQGGGLITAEDLAAYEVKEREPIRGTYRGYEILSAPPPSSGGVALMEILNILEGYDLGKLGSRSADSMHVTIEAFRRAMFDRAEFLGDPDFAKIPVAQLTDKKYGRAWRAELNPERATPSDAMRRPAEFNELDRLATHQPFRESDHTTHYSVVDAQGNAVAVTTTINDSFGSRVTVPGLGFLLNNEMDDFTSKAGVPNSYGLIQSENNSVGPGKRPLSAMTPTIVVKDGKPFLVIGSPGGPRIITTVANILMGVIDYGMNIQEAVAAARFHHQYLPDFVRVERMGISPDTIATLEKRGHQVLVSNKETDKGYSGGYWSTHAECIMVEPGVGLWGAPDPRSVNSAAVGY